MKKKAMPFPYLISFRKDIDPLDFREWVISDVNILLKSVLHRRRAEFCVTVIK